MSYNFGDSSETTTSKDYPTLSVLNQDNSQSQQIGNNFISGQNEFQNNIKSKQNINMQNPIQNQDNQFKEKNNFNDEKNISNTQVNDDKLNIAYCSKRIGNEEQSDNMYTQNIQYQQKENYSLPPKNKGMFPPPPFFPHPNYGPYPYEQAYC